jgi:hypothetical protein
MKNVSRRNVMAGVFAAPAGTVPCAALMHPTLSAGPDELAAKAAGWIAANERLTAMQLRWQAMRALDGEIEETRRQLNAAAGEIRLVQATTIAGAIAKIELGLRVQGPFDWQDHARELLEDGIAELRGLL